jgi:hypothetical protein
LNMDILVEETPTHFRVKVPVIYEPSDWFTIIALKLCKWNEHVLSNTKKDD